MAPTVFLSSTVKDLADLRSAVRFFLEQYGFEVWISESPDFPHDLDDETKLAALRPIEDADYYVLIVGNRTGTLTNEGISVTRSEFRRARELHRVAGRPQLVLLVRDGVLDAVRRADSNGPTEADNWPHLIDFVAEISSAEDANWVHPFRSFHEVATVMRTALRLSGPVRRLALEANLDEELGSNAEHLLARLGDLVVPVGRLLMPHLVPPPTDEEANLDRHQTASIWVFRFSLPGPNVLATVALTDAISSGDFLEFDPTSGRMATSVLQAAMLSLRQRIARYETLLSILSGGTDARELATLTGHRVADVVPVSADLRTTLYAIRDEVDNVAGLTRALLRTLRGVDEALLVPALNPPTPLPAEAERIQAATVTRRDALEWALAEIAPNPARGEGVVEAP
jgi:Domain of unknown function (DUF4062)